MYIPNIFKVDDQEIINGFIASYPFATLISAVTGDISHIPIIRRPDGRLEGHFAINNSHKRCVTSDDNSVIVIFHGPHAYISPTWYTKGKEAVPTWNYSVVHVHGKIEPLFTEQELYDHFIRLIETFESGISPRWSLESVSPEFITKLSKAVVGFSIKITNIEAKFKLGQNRGHDDVKGIISALNNSPIESDKIFASFSEKFGLIQ